MYSLSTQIQNTKESMKKRSDDNIKVKEDRNSLSVRQGDWVCVTCSNLNFSFRQLCNRCKIQCRKTNYFEFYFATPELHHQNFVSPASEKAGIEQKWPNPDSDHKPFENAILLTPVKETLRDSIEGEPYKSPDELPSVSPLLKKYNRIVQWEQLTNQTRLKSHSRAIENMPRTSVKVTSFIEESSCEKGQPQLEDIYLQIQKIFQNMRVEDGNQV